MRIKYLLIYVLLCSCFMLSAEHLHLSIRYLGIKVVNVDMLDTGKSLSISAQATGIGSIASSMDNIYSSNYLGDYLPIQYQKSISQKNYSEDRITTYFRDQLLASRQSFINDTFNREYPIHQESRDFFSALYYIRYHLENPQTIYLDANTLIWEAQYEVIKTEEIKTAMGKQSAYVVEVKFTKISQTQRERSDMLSNNLVNEDNILTLWISNSQQRLPLKARYSMKPFSVFWVLESYE